MGVLKIKTEDGIKVIGGGGGFVDLDTTLSTEGKAADSGAVGAALADKQPLVRVQAEEPVGDPIGSFWYDTDDMTTSDVSGDSNSEWEVICDITTTEQIDAGIIITQNNDGVSLSELKYTEIWIMTKMIGIDGNSHNWWATKCKAHQIAGGNILNNPYSNGASAGGTTGTRYISYHHFIRGGKYYWTDGTRQDVFAITGGEQAWLNNYLDTYSFDYFEEIQIVGEATRVIGVDTEIRILGRRG